jgi:hypothetical protein
VDYVTAAPLAYLALHKGEELGGYERTYVPMHHTHSCCLNRTVAHLVLPCNLQMSGTGLGPSAATTSKWPKRKKQGWLKKENLRRQRESTTRAAEGADPASGAHNPGECTFNFCTLREDGCTCGPDASSYSSTCSCSPLSGQWSKPVDIGRIFDAGPGIKWCAQCDVSQR